MVKISLYLTTKYTKRKRVYNPSGYIVPITTSLIWPQISVDQLSLRGVYLTLVLYINFVVRETSRESPGVSLHRPPDGLFKSLHMLTTNKSPKHQPVTTKMMRNTMGCSFSSKLFHTHSWLMKPQLKFGHGWMITAHAVQWAWLFKKIRSFLSLWWKTLSAYMCNTVHCICFPMITPFHTWMLCG